MAGPIYGTRGVGKLTCEPEKALIWRRNWDGRKFLGGKSYIAQRLYWDRAVLRQKSNAFQVWLA